MKKIDIYAHRSGAGLAPENSLPAFKTALALGVDVLDMDVVITADEVVAVYHDLCLNSDYTSDNKGSFDIPKIPIYELNFSDLEKYDVGRLNPDSEYAKLYPYQYSIADTRIPSLQQVFSWLGKQPIRFQIELKRDPNKPELSIDSKRYAQLINDVIVAENMQDKVEVHSFDWELLHQLYKVNQAICTTFISSTREAFSHELDFTEICHLGGRGWCPDFFDVTKELVQQAHDNNLKVVPWTVDKERDMLAMIGCGVDGIISNRPGILRGLLAARDLLNRPFVY